MSLLVDGQVRPYPGEIVSGDTWTHFAIEQGTRIVLIDGAGHGPLAYQAAEAAKATFEELADRPAEIALRTCHSRLHGTRGAVISVVDILESSLNFIGVGNVDGRLFGAGAQHRRLTPDRGLIGASFPQRLHTWTEPLSTSGWRLLLFSDGVMQRMVLEWEDLADLSSTGALLGSLLERWGRQTDDATLVIAGNAGHS